MVEDAAAMQHQPQQQQQHQQHQHLFKPPGSSRPGHWPATAELQRPAAPPSVLSRWVPDRQLLAALVVILLACFVSLHLGHGVDPQPQASSAQLNNPASTSYASIPILSSVLGVDLAAELLLLEFKVPQHGPAVAAACSAPNAAEFEVAVWPHTPSTSPPAAVLPLCPGGSNTTAGALAPEQFATYKVPIPLVQLNQLNPPFEELGAELRLVLRCAEGVCSAAPHNMPGVSWSAHWACPSMQVQAERHVSAAVTAMLDAADAFSPLDERALPYLEAVGLHRPSSEVAYRLLLTRSSDVRVLQLLFALGQVCVIIYCLMMGVGQVVWAYVLSRLLCMRGHMTRNHGRRASLEQ